MIVSVKDVLTSSGRYPERETHKEVTPEVISNINKLILAVNAFLTEVGITNASISSGFRPSDVNANIPNAAKRSLHMRGLALDLVDSDGKLDQLFASKPELLRKYGLWLEDPASTINWTHCDIGQRLDRPSRIFKP